MARCFVIQPFDGGAFDKRYDDVIAPAISQAGLEPYRVDRDPSVAILIENIESEIRDSVVCLADITTDNPNVWFELGFAIACGKDVVLVCSAARDSRFPFDVQHRNIIKYAPESPRDFDVLSSRIVQHLASVVQKQRELQNISSLAPVRDTEGLSPHEVVALVVIMANRLTPESTVAPYKIRNDMASAGFTEIAVALSLVSLHQKKMIELVDEYDGRIEERYKAYGITPAGIQWLLNNQDRLRLTADE